MVRWAEAKRRLAILKHYKDYGFRKTKDESNVSNTQIQTYKKQIAELLATVRNGRELDAKRNAKRPRGHAGRANERKAKKQKHFGQRLAQNSRRPQYVYLDQRVLEWIEKAMVTAMRKSGFETLFQHFP